VFVVPNNDSRVECFSFPFIVIDSFPYMGSGKSL